MPFHAHPPIHPERYEHYRRCVGGLDIPLEEIDELIGIVHSIMSHFVDAAFGVQTDQITVQSCGKHVDRLPGHGRLSQHPENQTASVQGDGAEGDSNPLGPSEP